MKTLNYAQAYRSFNELVNDTTDVESLDELFTKIEAFGIDFEQYLDMLAKGANKLASLDIEHGDFKAIFNEDVGYLKAGAPIHLQLSDDVEGIKEGPSYATSTLGMCNAILKARYTPEQLSLMTITGGSYVGHLRFKEVDCKASEIHDGVMKSLEVKLMILQDDDCYYMVAQDDYHAGTNDKVWYRRTDLDWAFDVLDLERMFDEAK